LRLVPAPSVSTPRVLARDAATSWARDLGGALVLAVAIPIVFLHVRYQPKVHVGLGSTSAGIELSDLAVLAVALTALRSGLREGFAPLRATRWIWVALAAVVAMVVAATFYPLLWQEHYRFLTHLVTAAKFAEYTLLAPAVPLLLRRRRDVDVLLWAVAGWSAAASAWGLLQFSGLVDEFEGRRPLQREPSFLGVHDLAALSGAALAIGLALLALRPRTTRERALAWIGGASGAIGLVLSGAVAGALGIALAALAALLVAARRHVLDLVRGAAAVAIAVAVGLGVLLMRSGDVTDFLRYLGLGHEPRAERDVESYVHRSLLAYIGVKIFADHPIVGVGWQGSEELENYGPYLDDAHRRFPGEPAAAFPSPEHAWGVQNAYLQTLTDTGLVGFALLVGLFAAGLVLGVRAALRGPPDLTLVALGGLLWLLVAAGVWNGLGLVAGIPLDALTWLAFGLVAAAAAGTVRGRG
jgi:O-Antigen ligase